MRFVYNTFILDRAEYAKICREIRITVNIKINLLQFLHHMELITDHIGIILRIMDMITIIYIYENRNVRGRSYGRIKKTAQQYR